MKALPLRMLVDAATLYIPEGVDVWKDRTGSSVVDLERVCVQRATRIDADDVKQTLELYFDARLSQPSGLDFIALKRAADDVNARLMLEYRGATYTINAADELRDGYGGIHHYRIEAV